MLIPFIHQKVIAGRPWGTRGRARSIGPTLEKDYQDLGRNYIGDKEFKYCSG